MPRVGGKEYPYTRAGKRRAAAKRAKAGARMPSRTARQRKKQMARKRKR